MGPEVLDRPHLQAAYREWMRQVYAVDQALALVSDEGLRWYLSGKPRWQAYRVEPYNHNLAVCFDARGRIAQVGADLLSTREVLTLSSFPPEVLAICRSKPPTTLQELLRRMRQAFPGLEVLDDHDVSVGYLSVEESSKW